MAARLIRAGRVPVPVQHRKEEVALMVLYHQLGTGLCGRRNEPHPELGSASVLYVFE